MDSIKGATRLAVTGKLSRLQIEGPRRPCLVDGDIGCTDAGAVHAGVRNEVASGIDHSDVLRAANGLCFFFRTRNDSACLF
jgi:hypothetical protein